MVWVVDTCVLLDIAMQDSRLGELSAFSLAEKVDDALVVAPVTYVELAPFFKGDIKSQNDFLNGLYLDYNFPEGDEMRYAAHQAWNAHIQRKRISGERKRPMADVLIGAYAKSLGAGLITRNEADFKTLYPDLTICNPATEGMI